MRAQGDEERIRGGGRCNPMCRSRSRWSRDSSETVDEAALLGRTGNERSDLEPADAWRTKPSEAGLLDLGFLELDVLARDRVVLAEDIFSVWLRGFFLVT